MVGYALFVAQSGARHPVAKPFKGELRGLVEIIDDWEGNTYRAVYTAKLAGVIYVLHTSFRRRLRKVSQLRATSLS